MIQKWIPLNFKYQKKEINGCQDNIKSQLNPSKMSKLIAKKPQEAK